MGNPQRGFPPNTMPRQSTSTPSAYGSAAPSKRERRQRRREQAERARDEQYFELGRHLADPLGEYRRFLEQVRSAGIEAVDYLQIPVNLVELTASLITSLLTGRRLRSDRIHSQSQSHGSLASINSSSSAGRGGWTEGSFSDFAFLSSAASDGDMDLGADSDAQFSRTRTSAPQSEASSPASHRRSGSKSSRRARRARSSRSRAAQEGSLDSIAEGDMGTSAASLDAGASSRPSTPASSTATPIQNSQNSRSHRNTGPGSHYDESIFSFILNIIQRTQLSCSTFIFGLILAYRLNQRERSMKPSMLFSLRRSNHEQVKYGGHVETFLSSVICADKYLYDATYTNQDWANFSDGRYALKDINAMERAFLERLDYNLFVHESDFDEFLTYLDLMLCLRQLTRWQSWGSLTYRDLLRLSYRWTSKPKPPSADTATTASWSSLSQSWGSLSSSLLSLVSPAAGLAMPSLPPANHGGGTPSSSMSLLRHSRLIMRKSLAPFEALVLLASHIARIALQYVIAVFVAVGVAALVFEIRSRLLSQPSPVQSPPVH
ncbi:hypothetical protein BC831DRAFT_440831 [Entophlyctis helioformis]|nr:hypothetical protein BC831DRAFT_440831 [Entophlyctis helioformis]